jgi:hypothetical protein
MPPAIRTGVGIAVAEDAQDAERVAFAKARHARRRAPDGLIEDLGDRAALVRVGVGDAEGAGKERIRPAFETEHDERRRARAAGERVVAEAQPPHRGADPFVEENRRNHPIHRAADDPHRPPKLSRAARGGTPRFPTRLSRFRRRSKPPSFASRRSRGPRWRRSGGRSATTKGGPRPCPAKRRRTD